MSKWGYELTERRLLAELGILVLVIKGQRIYFSVSVYDTILFKENNKRIRDFVFVIEGERMFCGSV